MEAAKIGAYAVPTMDEALAMAAKLTSGKTIGVIPYGADVIIRPLWFRFFGCGHRSLISRYALGADPVPGTNCFLIIYGVIRAYLHSSSIRGASVYLFLGELRKNYQSVFRMPLLGLYFKGFSKDS